MLKRLLALFVLALVFLPANVSLGCGAAEELTASSRLLADGKADSRLTDGSIYTYTSVKELDIQSKEKIFGLYIKFDRVYGEWTLLADGEALSCGENDFLHEFVEMGGANSLKLSFPDTASIAEVYVYGEGDVPDNVQRWELLDKADIMICPTHSDDDQLYFAGMIPWCAAKGYAVQIVYLTNHNNTHDRPHELLDGLWHNGLRYYPYISKYPDLYSESFEEAVEDYSRTGVEYNGFVQFYVELLNRYKPLVVAGHDSEGEYGHGVHILNYRCLTEAIELSAKNGLWDVPKTYIHKWKQNAVSFNWDIPMEELGGKTPFEVSQEGYRFHRSQHRFESLTRWLYGTESAPITKASQIRTHSPCSYGLYRTTVGKDSTENGIFENLKSYGEQEEERKRLSLAVAMGGESRKKELLQSVLSASLKLPLAYSESKEEQSAAESAEQSVPDVSEGSAKPILKNTAIVITLSAIVILVSIISISSKRKTKEKKK